jgi:hypothetical protein
MNTDGTAASAAEGTARSWCSAAEHGDTAAAVECLAADIEIISPLTAAFRFRRRDQAHEMLAAAFTVIDEIRFHTDIGDHCTRALFYRGRCGAQQFEEAQLVRFDEAGLITELTLFGRPLPGLAAVMARIGPELLRAQRRLVMARVVAAATGPLAALTKLGEQRLVPLADPSRRASGR